MRSSITGNEMIAIAFASGLLVGIGSGQLAEQYLTAPNIDTEVSVLRYAIQEVSSRPESDLRNDALMALRALRDATIAEQKAK